MKIQYHDDDKKYVTIFCEGCKYYHTVRIDGKGKHNWTFNNDLDSPTLSPSILVTQPLPSHTHICHSFITDGNISYLSDCTHELAGQTVELKDINVHKV